MSALEFEVGTRVKVIDPSHPLCGLFYDVTDATEVRAGEWRYALEGSEECSWRAEQLARVAPDAAVPAGYAVDDVIRHGDAPAEYVVTKVAADGALHLKSKDNAFTFTISAYAASTYYTRCHPRETWYERVARLACEVDTAEKQLAAAQRAVVAAQEVYDTATRLLRNATSPAAIRAEVP